MQRSTANLKLLKRNTSLPIVYIIVCSSKIPNNIRSAEVYVKNLICVSHKHIVRLRCPNHGSVSSFCVDDANEKNANLAMSCHQICHHRAPMDQKTSKLFPLQVLQVQLFASFIRYNKFLHKRGRNDTERFYCYKYLTKNLLTNLP